MLFQIPSTSEEWKEVSNGFLSKWNYPCCIGALDGKHIAIKKPNNSGSQYFNYKGFLSILLFALASHDYKIFYVDVGAPGRSGDAGIFNDDTLKKKMDDGTICFPEPEELQGTESQCNYHLIGDDAFPLRKDIMKPYPFRQLDFEQHVFNYRLSRARRVVENAFGILANRFRVFLTTIALEPSKITNVVLAACCLHNMLIDEQPTYISAVDQENENHQEGGGCWRTDLRLESMEKTKTRNCSLSAKTQRQLLKTYFNSKSGSVSWQERMIAVKKPASN